MLKPKQKIPSTDFENQVYHGDSQQLLKSLPDNSVDLIITSPPYANQRSKSYGGIKASDYVEWFIPIAEQLKRVLSPDGSFVLNIKEHVEKGERHTYVLELILALKKMGWRWTEEYMWHKKNAFPGKWPNRFRDSFERCLHFNLQKDFYMDQDSVMVDMGDWKDKRFKYLSGNDLERYASQVGNSFAKNIANWKKRDKAYPGNVISLATNCRNVGHPAAFPESLPSWFIKLLSPENSVVLDPFLGSGTTALACINLKRKFIGIEVNKDYAFLSCEKITRELSLTTLKSIREEKSAASPATQA
ncbi:MAG: site-specific DNA-methyltransferase [Idiomarina sp.]|nr:site-specific DNA-methyltransferase [Idiomarinaceae bacterium]MBL4742371.1 site-specific DNA-methyltransferase [Idiomarina sp.]PHQ77006.1 MAG: site-specific DNA-methyltransferase [Idiomarina sp.]